MNRKKLAHYFFAIVLLLLLYISFLIIKPYSTYILLSLILAFSFYPAYKKTKKFFKNESLSATLVIIFIIFIIILPMIFVTNSIIQQAGTAYQGYDQKLISKFSDDLNVRIGYDMKLSSRIKELFNLIINFIIKNIPSFVGGLADVIIGVFIMFVGIFYLFKKGHKINKVIMQYIPLKNNYKEDLIKEIKLVTHAVVYSQVLISLLQGLLAGISFAIFGVPNPLFWGFIAAILSFLPMVGAPIVWIPAGVIKIFLGNIGLGIGILIFNAIITMNIDNFMRPKIVGDKSKLHPFITLVGIIGGLKLFGFIGILLGPMIIALFLVLLKYFNKEF